MKKLLLISVWLISSWTIWGADIEPKFVTHKYNPREVSIDLFGSASLRQHTINHLTSDGIKDNARLGAGVGVNYFHTHNFGVGLEAYSENTGHSLIDAGSVNLLGRLPLKDSGFAPYGYSGIGYHFESSSAAFAQIGAGLEYRFNPKFGAFADTRYVFTDGTQNFWLGRIGIRVCF